MCRAFERFFVQDMYYVYECYTNTHNARKRSDEAKIKLTVRLYGNSIFLHRGNWEIGPVVESGRSSFLFSLRKITIRKNYRPLRFPWDPCGARE